MNYHQHSHQHGCPRLIRLRLSFARVHESLVYCLEKYPNWYFTFQQDVYMVEVNACLHHMMLFMLQYLGI